MKYRNIRISGIWAIMLLVNACTYEVLPETEECVTPPALNVIEVEGSNCIQNNGSIQVAASGGAREYRYSIDGIAFQTESIFTGLSAGTYAITVRDESNCTATAEAAVQNVDGLNIIVASTIAGCGTANGTITVNAVGGEAPFLFSINNNGFQGENVFGGLSGGTYSVTAKDASGCEVTSEVKVLAGISSTDIQNIIETNCAVSGCHAGNVSPDLRSLDNIRNKADQIQIRTANKTMPPPSSSFSLTDTEIAAINCWVEDGALIDSK